MTLRLIPTNAERDYRGPLGMARCVWLLTFEHPSDLPIIYEWFGQHCFSVNRLYDREMIVFYWLMSGYFNHHAFEPSTKRGVDAYYDTPTFTKWCRSKRISN